MKKLNLNENFICRIWEDENNYSDLKTNDGRKVEILDRGKKNPDAGPDYSDAKIRIDGNIYSGSIEIHRTSNDWYLHGHQNDTKYNDVILHVALYDDLFSGNKNTATGRQDGIPTVVLSEFLSRSIHAIWRDIISKPSESFRLPCFPQNNEVFYDEKINFIKEAGLERLRQKSDKFRERISELKEYSDHGDPEDQVLFEYICEALGYSKNKKQFISLSRKIDVSVIRHLKMNRIQTESLIFGLSGFLSDLKIEDEYSEELFNNWVNVRKNIRREEMTRSEWNFFRLRPPNFPTLRLAYASGLLYEIVNRGFVKELISEFTDSSDIQNSMYNLFSRIKLSDYWERNYNFNKVSATSNRGIGNERIKDIISNVVFPFMYQRSFTENDPNMKNKVEFYFRNNRLMPSVNEISKVMQEQLGIKALNPATEQGLIHLHNYYCIFGKCSMCRIGKEVFREDSVHEPLKIIIY